MLWTYVTIPRFSENAGGPQAEEGYFGPWQTCKYLLYGRRKCGEGSTRFKPVGAVYLAGLVALTGTCVLAGFCILSIIQLAMVVSKEKVVCSYSFVVLAKMSLSLLATLISIVSAILFALQTDDRENDFVITRGESFYIQIIVIILTFLLFVATIYDVLFSRRLGGDPTMVSRDPSGEAATTFNNPGFKERKGISMTDASGKPYTRGSSNGSMATLSTTLSSNGSTIGTGPSLPRSPLRSSLKKPKNNSNNQEGAASGLGIQNPGFSGSSPTPSRNGSVKRVRIQTNSTAV
ncbi:unnamed protein product [Nesidiocoris tenuis]|uniref:Uncharacterized protein n=1 Tax=Nesidiocoris tenuis TaxID=355587 RepID=A0A6H5GK31_9HEMI|nr:unnamed protein product [Nesidiocoris tenuis]